MLGFMWSATGWLGVTLLVVLGAEVGNPLRMIPRAVIATAVFAGCFFVASAYIGGP